ncbi:intermembrane phospholipid transport protein YdbH family protein [Tsuneonella amylolytica]|uniref:intermembrane phospholipid transport protein YdbH family protein n=1 Tax=Tsuneonella amylolytica TaxID=2338327 RepID=UPI000EAA6569|nr:YdbH domain-containing protein [Tsuneonella amylolytica]
MAQASGELEEAIAIEEARARRRWPRVLIGVVLLVLALLAAAWLSRERIAGNVIEGQLREYDIPATYEIERIAPDRQVLKNVVVGDPRSPDLTIERAEVAIRYRLGTPQLGRVTLIRPRLYGTLRGGTLSFGTLDKALFRKTGAPPGLPKLDVRIADGRALIESDYGPLGIKAEGAGRIYDGFAGMIAVAAPRLDAAGCNARGATLYGKVSTSGGKPTIDGPLRIASFRCADRGVSLADAAIALKATADKDFGGVEGRGRIATGALAVAETRASSASGSMRATWRGDALTAKYTLAARGFAHPQARVALLTADGTLRARDGFGSAVLQSDLEGNGVRAGDALDRILAGGEAGVEGTLLAPLLRKARTALARESRASSFTASVTARKTADRLGVTIPNAALRGRSGATLLSLSQVALSSAGSGPPRFSGNLATGGAGLPRIVGRMERGPGGRAVLRMRMAEYAAGGAALEIPELVLAQAPGGTLGFAGQARASGPLPGGSTRNLLLPLQGTWGRGGLTMWTRCIDVRFDALALASLSLERRGVRVCPSRGQPILRQDGRGLRIAAGAPSLDLAGRLAQTPIRLRSGAVGFAYPGALSARAVDVSLGPVATASTFRISNLTATFGREIAGTFDDSDVRLFNVPLNLEGTSGKWRYAGGTLSISEGAFRLVDRQDARRFNPLVSEGGTLTLRDNVIDAQATMFEPGTRRKVTDVAIRHDLATGTGHADLSVPGILFDRRLQPDALFPLAKGVVANTRGVVTGTGRIDWSERGVTSTGAFSSDDLDFAAAFGPVKGASGTVVFSDLLNLTTAPGQKIRFASVNPGIEVTDGELAFSLTGGRILAVEGATWPFMGGTLTLTSTTLNLGQSEERRYVFEIVGLEAEQFVERMELPNISATGTFDGTMPIIFDNAGVGRIEGGLLIARPPGGNVSYVGELSRENLGAIANFAFDALKSLDYQQMSIGMDGNLTGEIVTRVRFDGVRQGAGAKRNFITRRFENLPIRFNVNVRAPFYQLITSLKSMYDPASVRDPRELGLLTDDGRVLKRAVSPPPPAIKPEDIVPDGPPIQSSESETKP